MSVIHRRYMAGILSAALMLAVCGCGAKEAVPDDKSYEQKQEESDLKTQASSDVALAEPEERQTKGAKTEEIPTVDATVYEQLLDRFAVLVSYPDEDYDAAEGETGVLEAARAMGGKDAPENIGYAIEDFSGDGIPELFIGGIEENGTVCRGTQIYAAYTISDGAPQLIFEGWYRNSYQYMGEGGFFNEGSSSAASSGFGTFRLQQDAMSLSCEDFYFTDWMDENFSEIGVWHNTSGEWDKSVSEQLDMTQEDFCQLEEEMRIKNSHSVELIPFSTICSTDEMWEEDEMPVRVQWAEDVDFFEDCDVYDISASEPQSYIVFTTDSFVDCFTILELTLTDVSESGNMEFDAYPALPQISGLIPDSPLAIGLTFAGDIPCYGFQYEDENGDVRRFALEISGEDGSILIREASREYYNFILEAGGE